MGIIIGTIFAGQIKTLHGQYISSKLFFLGIPLFPTMSMLVVKHEFFQGRNGIEIPKNYRSIAAAFMRIFLIPATIFIFYISDLQTISGRSILFIFLASILTYVWFIFGKSTAKENFAREQFGDLFQIYFLPEWLYYEDLEKFQKAAALQYNLEIGDEDWESRLKSMKPNDQKFNLVYCTAYLTIQLKDLVNKRNILETKYEEYLSNKAAQHTLSRK